MKTNLTEIIFIVDRSGSMSGLESDTIGGYNSFLDAQRRIDGEANITTVLFDNHYEILHDGVDLKYVTPITEREYYARGSTALLDAIGKTIVDIGYRLSNTAESERPDKVIIVITTDGYENSSKEFSYQKINEMIKHQQDKYNWEFIFLGANINAEREAENLGIKSSMASNYNADSSGINKVFSEMSNNISSYRNTGKIKENWKDRINKENAKK